MHNKHASRAKLFLSFDSLKPFKEYIYQVEKKVVKPKELSVDEYEVLNRKIQLIKVGKKISVVYYDCHDYVKKEGMVSMIDLDRKLLRIVNEEISMMNIIEISGEGIDE